MSELPPPCLDTGGAAWLPLQLPWQPDGIFAAPLVRWWLHQGRFCWEIRAPRPLAARDTFQTRGFIEGLWEQDLAECFILEPGSGVYTEYNLGPGGAWWSARFTAPRIRAATQPAPAGLGVQTKVVWDDHQWTGRMSFPLPRTDGPLAVNFAAIVVRPEGRQFYSLAMLGGGQPDFHRPGEWRLEPMGDSVNPNESRSAGTARSWQAAAPTPQVPGKLEGLPS